jgi:cyclopropane fatty-acyl-phospholipid synthase-like methyltransferase
MKIDAHGYWHGTAVGHYVDYGLAQGIADFLQLKQARSVLDLGCGNGGYTRYLQSRGFTCLGVDGNPNTKEFGRDLAIADLSQLHWFGKFDWVVSLEVGEHIPKVYQDTFIENIDIHNTNGVILSWSIPEFGGDGHVNSLPNEKVIELFEERGYRYHTLMSLHLRTKCAKYPNDGWWFSETLMVFERNKE